MDLNWVKLSGYKRFENATLNTSGKVVAIVGPNEAGKSSLLQALEHLNHDHRFQPEEITREQKIQDNEIILEAGFILDDNDRQAISHVYGGDQVRWLKIQKQKTGTWEYDIEPLLQSDPIIYQQTIDALKVASKTLPLRDIINKNLLEELESVLEGSQLLNLIFADNLYWEFKHFLKEFFLKYKNIKDKNTILNLKELQNIISYLETHLQPCQEISRILAKRIPRILFFNESQRNLSTTYNLVEIGDFKPAPALDNLLKNLANLDIKILGDAINKDNRAELKNLEKKANKQIAAKIEGTWSQSGINVVLDINQNLNIIIEDEKGKFTNFHERSDGLRQFIALIAFLECQNTENDLSKPILLVDEAEIHLHYDGQADLMKMFAKQQLVSKIIYTTHSAGCLPEDIGVGVKVVEPIPGQERSKINNAFWNDSEKRFGFAPLLFGMGGSTLAYVPIRKAVFVEGITDLILLPTIFRKVTKKEYLGFQVIPGSSQVPPEGICLIENHAPSSVFLFDADQAGDQYIKDFQKYGINKSRLFHLPLDDHGEVLEDAIKEDLYLEAVNKEIQRRYKDLNQPMPQITLSDISGKNRPTLVKQWCKSQGIANPEKREIAYHLIELSIERQETLLRPELEQPFKELYAKILESLELQIDMEC